MNRLLLVLLGLAAAVGLALAAGLAFSPAARRSLGLASASPRPTSSAPTVAAPARGPTGDGGAAADLPASLRDAGGQLLSGDLPDVVAKLRAAGFPPAIVRAIMNALVSEQFAARRRKILGDQPVPPYWKADSMLSILGSPQMAELRALARQEQDRLKQLLGPDSATSEMARLFQQRTFGDLSQDKIDAIQRIRQDYSDLKSQIYAEAGGAMLPWDREKLTMLDREQRNDLTGVLTAEELRQYDLRSSPTAQRLQRQLALFSPTEQEFQAIYDLQSPFDEKYNLLGLGGTNLAEQGRQRQADQQQLQAQLKTVLGDARYQDYQRSIDPGYLAANRIVSTLQLPSENATATWNLQQNTQQQLLALRTGAGMTGAERMQALQQLATQAEQQVTSLLTPAGADAYRQTSGGQWLRSIETISHRGNPPATPGPSGAANPPASPVVTPPRT